MNQADFKNLYITSKKIDIDDKNSIDVHVIPVESMADAFDIILDIINLIGPDTQPGLIPIVAAKQLMKLIPFSIDIPLKEIPGTILPEIFDAIVELNLTEKVLKNWQALIQKLTAKFQEVTKRAKGEQDQEEKKEEEKKVSSKRSPN